MSIIAQWGRFTNTEEDEGEIYDLTGNNNTGVLHDNAELNLIGARGRVLNFSGSDASVRVPDSPTVSPTTAISVGAWIYKTDMSQAMIVDKDACYRLWIPLNDNVPCFNVYAGGAWREFQATSLVIPTNQWVFLQAGYDSATNTVQMYCQGSMNSENTSWNHGIVNDNDYQLYLGKYSPGGYLFKGYIGEVIIRDELVDLATHRTDLKGWLKKRSRTVIEFLELHIKGVAPILITTNSESVVATVYDIYTTTTTTTTTTSSTTVIPPSFLLGWGRRCELVIQSSKVISDCSDFPVLITEDALPSEIFDADGSNPALNGGGDIRFSSDSAGHNQLSCEIEQFITDNDPVNGKASIWVKVESLASVSNTSIWVWYNKSGESQPAKDSTYGSENVWDSNFKMVQHMNQDPSGSSPQMIDSTSNNNNGTSYGSMPFGALIDGQIGKCLDFDGATEDKYINFGDITSYFSDEATLSMFIKLDNNIPVSIEQTGLLNATTSTDITYYPYLNGDIYIGTFRNDRMSLGNIGVNKANWHQLTITNKPGTNNWIVYQNGSSIYTTTGESQIYLPSAFLVGRNDTGSRSVDGAIDEIRISNTARSAGWIETEYNNQNSPETFIIEGAPSDPS